MVATNKSSARLPRAKRRQQLVQVARDVFAEHGFDAATLEQIAEQAGISRPILYSHFGDKQGLFEAVVEQEASRLKAVVMQSLIEPGESHQLLERSLCAFFTDMHDNPAGHVVLTRDAPLGLTNSGLDQMLAGLGEQITAVIITSSDPSATKDQTPAPVFAHALIGACFHIGRWWRDHPEVPLDQVVSTATALFWTGFHGIKSR